MASLPIFTIKINDSCRELYHTWIQAIYSDQPAEVTPYMVVKSKGIRPKIPETFRFWKSILLCLDEDFGTFGKCTYIYHKNQQFMYVVIYQSHGWYGDLESCFHHPRFLFRKLQATLLSSMDGDPQEGNKTSFGCLKGLMLGALFFWENVRMWN